MTRSLMVLMVFAAGLSFSARAAVCVTANVAELKKEPNLKAPTTWVVGKYMPLVDQERKGRWLKVEDLDGETHWVQVKSVSRKVRCVAVKTTVANMRSGPGMQFPLAEIQTVDRYTPLKRLESDGPWIQVEDEAGLQAWVHETNIWKPMKIQKIGF